MLYRMMASTLSSPTPLVIVAVCVSCLACQTHTSTITFDFEQSSSTNPWSRLDDYMTPYLPDLSAGDKMSAHPYIPSGVDVVSARCLVSDTHPDEDITLELMLKWRDGGSSCGNTSSSGSAGLQEIHVDMNWCGNITNNDATNEEYAMYYVKVGSSSDDDRHKVYQCSLAWEE